MFVLYVFDIIVWLTTMMTLTLTLTTLKTIIM